MTKKEAKKKLASLKGMRTSRRKKVAAKKGELVLARAKKDEHKYDFESDEERTSFHQARAEAETRAMELKFEIEDLEHELEELKDEMVDYQLILRAEDAEERAAREERKFEAEFGAFERIMGKVLDGFERVTEDDKQLDRLIGVASKIAGKVGASTDRFMAETKRQQARYKAEKKKETEVADAPEVPEEVAAE